MISLLILEVNKCLIFSLDFYVFVLNFFLKNFIDFTTIILRLSFEIILKLTNVSYFLRWICCFWGTMSFCSHFHVFSLDFIFVEIWNNTCSKKKISEYSKLLRRRRKKIAESPSSRIQFCSVQFSCSVMSESLRPHESQQARPLCPSPAPGVYRNSCPSIQWWHPAISSSVVPLSSCPQSLPASESFRISQLFAWGGQSTGVSALASFLPKNTQGWSPSEWTGWISLQSKGLPRVFSNTTVQKHQFFGTQPSSQSNSHMHIWPLEKS